MTGSIALLVGLALSSCSSDKKSTNEPDPNEPFPHSIPSVATMQVDTEDLGTVSPTGEAGLCHAVSAIVVVWVDANVRLRLAIPVGAFVACVSTVPVYIGDDTWRWTATQGQGSDMATGELTAHVVSESRIDWEMRVSGTFRGLDRFLWFRGSSDPGAGSGIWHYYDPMFLDTPKEVVQCTWSQEPAPGGTREVEFVNVEAGNPNIGDRLRYRLVEYAASIHYRNAAQAESTDVSWSLLTGEGRTVNAAGDSCCWGARPLFPDVACSSAAKGGGTR
jgi:hypothetical protein